MLLINFDNNCGQIKKKNSSVYVMSRLYKHDHGRYQGHLPIY